MKDKTKYKIWEIKNYNIGKILFYIKRFFYKLENKIENERKKINSLIKELIISCIYFLVTSLIIVGLLITERFLYEKFFINCETIKEIVTFSEEFFYQFLIASLGISGVLIALFYANLSGVFSSKYANIDIALSFEILKEKENKRNIKSIENYIITDIILLMFYMVGIKHNYLIMSFFILYTIKVIITFIKLSQRIFYFTNLNFITKKECEEICNNSKKVQVNEKYYDSKEFQNYYQTRTRENIENLNKLV